MNNRRNFIKKAGMGAALASVSAPLAAKAATSHFEVSNKKGKNEGEQIKIKITKPLFCPYHSIGDRAQKGGDAYYFQSDAFSHNPFTIPASGMSGSPVIRDAAGKFVGFMTTFGYEDSTFSFDGKETLTIYVPDGQEVFVDEGGDGEKAWKTYNTKMMERLNIQPYKVYPHFWADVEYCTWVEQKIQSNVPKGHFNILNHDFVAKYLDKIVEYGYPKGKMTLDHGWGQFPDGSLNSGYGSWSPDPKKFPDFHKTMDLINEKGFTPGLWIGFPKIHAASTAAQNNPNLLGAFRAEGKTEYDKGVRWLNPKSDIFEYASETIYRFHQMGVRKFKIDMSYNTKSDMLHIHKELYKAAKGIDETIEMEFHVPDIFFTKFTDVTRTNDVWLNDKYDWPARVKTHYEISYKSSPGRGINLDHIGGNAEKDITEEKYLQHLEMFKSKIGYPLVSVLPHHISQKCVDETGDYLWDYEKGSRNIISDFY